MIWSLVEIGVVSGLLLGLVYALMSIGFNLSLGIARVVNLQHGAAILWSMYAAYFGWTRWGINPFFLVPLISVVAFFYGYAIQRALLDRALTVPEDSQILFSLGLLIALQYLAQYFFTTDSLMLEPASLAVVVTVGELYLQYSQLAAAALAIAGLVLLHLLLRHTDLGRNLRACAQNSAAAKMCGLNVRHLYAVAMGISCVGAAFAGVAAATLVPIVPDLAFQYAIMAVVVSVLGGLGSVTGSLVAGLIVGVAVCLLQAFSYGAIAQAMLYAVVFVVFLVRPTGLFGSRLA
jgi:branched-chain amino acid transport system permease protein